MISQPNGAEADSENTGFGYLEFIRYDVSRLLMTAAGSAAPPHHAGRELPPAGRQAVARGVGRQTP
jgi:hypothetical protein